MQVSIIYLTVLIKKQECITQKSIQQ